MTSCKGVGRFKIDSTPCPIRKPIPAVTHRSSIDLLTTMLFSSIAARCYGRSSLTRSAASRIIIGGRSSSRILKKNNPRFLSGGAQLAQLKAENPHTNVVHYTHKNLTFTVQQVDYYSEALAIGLAENGLTTGDVVLSWLPPHFAESVRGPPRYIDASLPHRQYSSLSSITDDSSIRLFQSRIRLVPPRSNRH